MRVIQTASAATGIFLAAALYHPNLTAISQSRQPCWEDGYAMVEHLKGHPFNEALKATATTPRGNIVMWLANDLTGTWSQIVVFPPSAYGLSSPGCLTSSGYDWFIEPALPPGDPS